ncbi:MAG: hypothetical protein MJ108_01310 [Saccharofermentans sp.]|nr:hypothetical protein [Saccharofermentans sp.]
MIEEVLFENEIMIHSLSSLPSKGLYLAEFQLVEPFEGDSKELMGALLLEDDNMTFDPPMFAVPDFAHNSQQLLLDIARGCIDAGSHPEIIIYTNEDARQLLADFCAKVGINLIDAQEFAESMPFMQDLEKYDDDSDDWEEFADQYELSDEDRMEVIAQALMMFTDEEIKELDQDVINEAKDLINLGAFPPDMEKEFRRKLGMDGGKE